MASPTIKIAAALAAASLLMGCLGEEKPKCVPNPMLKCVLEAAVVALGEAGPVAEYDDMGVIARAQKKFGDSEGFERTVGYARSRNYELEKRAPLPESRTILRNELNAFLAKVEGKGEDRPDLERWLASIAASEDWADRKRRRIEYYVEVLMRLGRKQEAIDAIAQQRGWLEANRQTLDLADRNKGPLSFLHDLFRSYLLVDDKEGAKSVAVEMRDVIKAMPKTKEPLDNFEGEANVRDHMSLATNLVEAKLTPLAHAVIADAAKLIGPLPSPGAKVGKDIWWKAWNYGTQLQRLTLKARSVPADAAIAEMTRLRAALATEALAGMQAEQLRDDVAAILDAGIAPPATVREETARILERLKSEGARKLEFSAPGEVYAMLGDESAVRTVIGAMGKGETDWEIPDRTRALCVVMAKRGHIEAALKCAPQLTGSQNWQKANRVAVYAAVLRAMTAP